MMHLFYMHNKSLIVIAIIMMVGSGILGHYIISHNEKEIRSLQQDTERIDRIINEQWQDTARFERNTSYAVIISMLTRMEKGSDKWKLEALRDDFFHYLLPGKSGRTADLNSLKKLIKEAAEEREDAIDMVNDLYIDRSDMVMRISALEEDNRFFISLAFFMQLLGLVLVTLTRFR